MKPKTKLRLKQALAIIIVCGVFVATMDYVIYPAAVSFGDMDYDEEYQAQLEKWAYGQQFLNGTEQRDYYVSVGFFGSTYEDFLYFADNEATWAEKIRIDTIVFTTAIVIFLFDLIILLIIIPDKIKE